MTGESEEKKKRKKFRFRHPDYPLRVKIVGRRCKWEQKHPTNPSTEELNPHFSKEQPKKKSKLLKENQHFTCYFQQGAGLTVQEWQRVVTHTITFRDKTDGNSGHSRKIEAKQPTVRKKGHNEQGLCIRRLWQDPNSSGEDNSLMSKTRQGQPNFNGHQLKIPGTRSDQPHQSDGHLRRYSRPPECHDELHFLPAPSSHQGRKGEGGETP